jgi:hypothetical protein
MARLVGLDWPRVGRLGDVEALSSELDELG